MVTQPVLILSGPNLDLLGDREPEIYGPATLDDHVARAVARGAELGLTIDHIQSNSEAELVEAVHAARSTVAAIIINPAALTHYSWSLHDALAAFAGPVIELHLSNPAARESFRHQSVVAPVATGTIAGLGGHGYQLAVDAVAAMLT